MYLHMAIQLQTPIFPSNPFSGLVLGSGGVTAAEADLGSTHTWEPPRLHEKSIGTVT